MKSLALLLAFGWSSATPTVITFDNGPIGKAPPGWTVAMTHRGGAPRWEIRQDQTAPTKPYVLAQVSSDNTNGRAPLAILDGVDLRDGDVSVRIKPVAGKEDRAGGLVWRYHDENNYYEVRADALAKTVAVYKVQNGRLVQIGNLARHDIPSNDWSILKVSARGNRFQIYVDHRRILQGQDNTFTGGRVGVCTEADSVTYFDDFRVYPR
jgi:hypothetical protein